MHRIELPNMTKIDFLPASSHKKAMAVVTGLITVYCKAWEMLARTKFTDNCNTQFQMRVHDFFYSLFKTITTYPVFAAYNQFFPHRPWPTEAKREQVRNLPNKFQVNTHESHEIATTSFPELSTINNSQLRLTIMYWASYQAPTVVVFTDLLEPSVSSNSYSE